MVEEERVARAMMGIMIEPRRRRMDGWMKKMRDSGVLRECVLSHYLS